MPNPTKKRKPGRKTPPVSRDKLLPLSTSLAQDASLKAHIALATMRTGQGNVELLGELMTAVYLTYLLCAADRPDLADGFAAGQKALNDSFAAGMLQGQWTLEPDVATALQPILLEHDLQLARRSVHAIDSTKERLTRMLEEHRFPNLGKLSTSIRPDTVVEKSLAENEALARDAVC